MRPAASGDDRDGFPRPPPLDSPWNAAPSALRRAPVRGDPRALRDPGADGLHLVDREPVGAAAGRRGRDRSGRASRAPGRSSTASRDRRRRGCVQGGDDGRVEVVLHRGSPRVAGDAGVAGTRTERRAGACTSASCRSAPSEGGWACRRRSAAPGGAGWELGAACSSPGRRGRSAVAWMPCGGRHQETRGRQRPRVAVAAAAGAREEGQHLRAEVDRRRAGARVGSRVRRPRDDLELDDAATSPDRGARRRWPAGRSASCAFCGGRRVRR